MNVCFLCATAIVSGRPQVAMQQCRLSLFKMNFIMNYTVLNDMPNNM